ncbi:Protein of unknown function [Thermanaeromonas toyohensis ToBE]|uniref:DUF2922 domain-containing protein n=1 Tax=Thermanaeromonas toyohensis ToBE TaxID=698762 RepID=A0A1W1W339_9FIRM|nr:DUF2922 domain-containing protein [Thermanaeromonas toyohensis]SMC00035.1 Protein of unknown function [Thermanaeromonas toyohensis ToBE]
MLSKRLELIFQNASGRRITLTVQDPRADLTSGEVQATMEFILSRNIFTSSGGDLVAIAGARVVSREITDLITV